MPDALSKTVPIWCCVLNRVLFPAETAAHSLWTPPNVVSPSEHAQIEARLDGFVGSFKQLGFDLDSLRLQISRPLRPFWITPESHLTATEQIFEDFRPVICCTSSRRTLEGESCQGGSYIQGAGDDTENWALGLTAPIFWANKELLMSADEADLPELIASLVKSSTAAHGYKATKLNDYVSVSTLQTEAPEPEDDTCIVRLMPTVSEQKGWIRSKTVMEVGLGNRKIASRNLRHALPTICSFVSKFLETPNGQAAGEEDDRGRILIECETGRDLSIGVALAIMCQCFDDNGKPRNPGTGDGMHFTKEIIRTKLSRIMTTMPDANPSRATLQSVNSFLMG